MTIEQILLQDIREAISLDQRAIAVATFYRYCGVREIDVLMMIKRPTPKKEMANEN